MNILCKLGFHKPMQYVWVVLDDGQLYRKCSRCGKVLGHDKRKLKKSQKDGEDNG